MFRARRAVTRTTVNQDVTAVPGKIDSLYLFVCALESRNRGSAEAAWELLAALTSSDPATRNIAHVLLNAC